MASCVFITCLLLITTAVRAQAQEVDCHQSRDCSDPIPTEGVTLDFCSDMFRGRSYLDAGGVCTNFPIKFGFEQSNIVGVERGEDYSVNVGFLSGSLSQIIVLDVDVVLETAQMSDFLLITPRRIIRPSLPPEQLKFTLVADAVVQEMNETFTLKFDYDSSLFGPDDEVFNELNVTIIDGDTLEFELSEDDYRAVEDPGALMPVRISKHLNVRLANPVLFRITPLTVQQALDRNILDSFPPDDPTSPMRADKDDFNTTIFTVLFPADEELVLSEVPADILIYDDDIDEAEEQVFIAFMEVVDAVNPDSLITGVRDVAQCIIVDNDDIRIGFAQDLYQYYEPSTETLFGNVTLTKEDNRISEQTFQVNIAISNQTAPIRPAIRQREDTTSYDYRVDDDMLVLNFPPHLQSIPFAFFLNSDELPEGVEAFRARSSAAGGFPAFESPLESSNTAFQSTLIQIIDDDFARVGFEQLNYTIHEADSSQEICVLVFNPASDEPLVFDISLTYGTKTGTADGSDFVEIGQSPPLVFQELPTTTDSRRQCFSVLIGEDDISEETESFTLMLDFDRVTSQSVIQIDPQVTEIFILDDDEVVIGFVNGPYVANEIEGSVLVEIGLIGTTQQLQREVPIQLSYSDETALNGSDYLAGGQILLFGPGNISFSVALPLVIDDISEPTEIFQASLSFPGAPPPRVTISPGVTNITIFDDNVLVIGFEQDFYQVLESDGFVLIRFRILSGTPETSATVLFSAVDGGAVSGEDYITLNPLIFILDTNNYTYEIAVPIVDNDIQEATESFIISLTTTEEGTILLLDPANTTIEIVDDDSVQFTFREDNYTFNESDGLITVYVDKIGDTDQTVVLLLTRTLQAETDTTIEQEITFEPGDTEREITITLQYDIINLQQLQWSLTVLSPTDDGVVVQPFSSTTISIIDDTGPNNTVLVNDTVIGDPLFTVPILVREDQLRALNSTRLFLCYEIHGNSDQWFNLVTDECASVNARYEEFGAGLNVIDEIAVRAVDNADQCVNIRVAVANCTAEVNGALLGTTDKYSMNGVSVRRYRNRVRISVPNCNDLTLVMWVFCETRTVEDFVTGELVTGDMIKFVVLRGLNAGNRPSHGLLGQFWNTPVSIAPYEGLLVDGNRVSDHFVVNITTRGRGTLDTRSYIGSMYDVTWDFKKGPCLYVGSRQGGRVYEIRQPNDNVIEESYREYRVGGAFSEEGYDFGLFMEERCDASTVSLGQPDN